ncbi:MAG: hypothetical protein Q9191_004678, partial [Dirinaria sp. TL-2023a]
MEPLTLKPRHPVADDIECWDDDVDLQGVDDLQFRNVSTTTMASANASHHRDSISSRISTRSDRESSGGADEDWQVLLPDDDSSTTNAIASAKSAGIPIPNNVPASALLGGTIKRLGGRRLKKVLGDDWGEDLELPKIEQGGLKLKKAESKDFPDAIRQFSADFPSSPSPAKPAAGMTFMQRMESARKPIVGNRILDTFKDDDDGDFFEDVPTIKVAKNRSPQKPANLGAIPKPAKDAEDLENDIEFPPDGEPLRLSTRKEQPKTPASQQDDFDLEWAEGSLGTRFGGTRREARSNPSSAFSPSASSCLTAESEDDGLDGLVLPEGPLKFDEVLKKRLENVSPELAEPSPQKPVKQAAALKDDFFTGIDIGDGDVFDSKKLTLNRNIKLSAKRQTSPKRTATTLTFTNKAQPGITRIPKPPTHDRPRTTLESVSETGGPVPGYRRPQSRIGGHSAHSSISAIPTPSTPSSHAAAPSTPSRRGLTTKSSRDALKGESTNPTQHLKPKRSQPTLSGQSPARAQPSYQRPPSRNEFGHRQGMVSRPKTPIDRSGAESSLASARKPPVPFLPAGTSHAQSHHISIKSSRHNNRPNSSDSNENVPFNRPISRLSNVHHRPTTPTGRRDVAPESLAREAASKRTITKPTRRRAFGDGNELEVFDDLPTSASVESKFVKQPIARGAPKSVQMRSKLGLSHLNNSSSTIESSSAIPPSTPLSPIKQDFTPRFARDTNASRLAREQRIGSVGAALHSQSSLPTVRESGPLAPISTNWKARVEASSKGLASPSAQRVRRGKAPPQKPKLIKPMGDGHNQVKTLKGMQWNPTLFRWEGNENALAPFDVPVTPQSPTVPSATKTKAAPALIANVGATKGVQVVGGMVFDPQRMCWLKMAPTAATAANQPSYHHRTGSSNPMSPDTIEEDEDPFAGLDDLDDSKEKMSRGGGATNNKDDDHRHAAPAAGGGGGGKTNMDDEWLVGEEFDVGPA